MLHESGEALSWKVGGVRSLITTSAIAKKEHSKVAPEISDLAQLQVLPQEGGRTFSSPVRVQTSVYSPEY